MTPTPELRFVERTIKLGHFYQAVSEEGKLVPATQSYRVLQQLWVKQVFNEYGVAHNTDQVEWRDVPCIKDPKLTQTQPYEHL